MKNNIISKIIKEQVRSYINEYIGRDMVYLKDYFSQSKEAKINSLPYMYSFMFNDFLYDENIEFDKPTDDYYDGDNKLQKGDELDEYDVINWLSENNKELFKKFGEYIYDKIVSYTMPVHDAEYPAWSFFDDNITIIKNQWLVHFTDYAENIAKDGFKYGVDDMEKLGLTTQLGEFDKKYGGYNFSYTLGDYRKYAKSSNWRAKGYNYGNQAVIFNASGIRLWHDADQEYQTIFYGNTAKNIIPIIDGVDNDWAIYNIKTGNELFASDNIDDVINWLTTNYRQYRKVLHNRSESPLIAF